MSNVHFKIRVTAGDAIALGPGKIELLNLIHAHGSIAAAAKQMKMSYRRAWELVDVMNQCFDEPLVMRSVGGSQGGGAQLTALGHQVLAQYQAILLKFEQACQAELAFFYAHLK